MTINTFRYHLLWSFHPRSHRRSHEEKMIEASQRIIGQQNSNHSLAIDNRMCSSLSIAVPLNRSKRDALEKADEQRSGVQIPLPGPFLTTRGLRYWIEFLSSSCPTRTLAMPMPEAPFCSTKRTTFSFLNHRINNSFSLWFQSGINSHADACTYDPTDHSYNLTLSIPVFCVLSHAINQIQPSYIHQSNGISD
jgi:hypothetical protein